MSTTATRLSSTKPSRGTCRRATTSSKTRYKTTTSQPQNQAARPEVLCRARTNSTSNVSSVIFPQSGWRSYQRRRCSLAERKDGVTTIPRETICPLRQTKRHVPRRSRLSPRSTGLLKPSTSYHQEATIPRPSTVATTTTR